MRVPSSRFAPVLLLVAMSCGTDCESGSGSIYARNGLLRPLEFWGRMWDCVDESWDDWQRFGTVEAGTFAADGTPVFGVATFPTDAGRYEVQWRYSRRDDGGFGVTEINVIGGSVTEYSTADGSRAGPF